jgi:hypothetical protein
MPDLFVETTGQLFVASFISACPTTQIGRTQSAIVSELEC